MTFKAFKSIGELMAHQQKVNECLNAWIQDWQLTLKPGDFAYWLYLPNFEGNVADLNVCEENMSRLGAIPIYYEILPYERELGDPPLPMQRRIVKGYSHIEPMGEMGTVHIASLWAKITPEQFEKARRDGWPLWIPDWLRTRQK